MRKILMLAAAALMTGPLGGTAALAGDPEAGEQNFRQCASCHGIVDPEGNVIQRLAPTGPNLWGVIGRQAGAYEGYERFSSAMVEAGEQGLVWDEETFVAYVEDPVGYLREFLDDSRARGNMNHRLRGSAEDLYAYLATFGAEEDDDS